MRVPALGVLPLFNDEAVYLLRAARFPAMFVEAGPAGATLPDGKLVQELLLAALAPLPTDPLVPARLLSLACGLATALVLAAIGRSLGYPRAGLLAGALYALSPLALVHDVLALPDSMLALASALVLGASLRFGFRPGVERRDALWLGALLALASLIKLSGLLLFVVPVLAALLLPPGWPERRRRLALLRSTLIVALACLAALAPFHYGGAERAKLGGESTGRLLVIGRNAIAAGDWLLRYLPGPLLLPPLILLATRRPRQAPDTGMPVEPSSPAREPARLVACLLLAGLAIAAAFVLVGLTVYPRYLLPAWPSLLLATAIAADALWRSATRPGRLLATGCLALACAWSLGFAWRFATDPYGAPLAATDRAQYLEKWTAGHNLGRLLADLRAEAAARGGLILVNIDQPRLVNLAAQLYLHNTPGIRFVDVDLTHRSAAPRLEALASFDPTLLLTDAEVARAYALDSRLPALQLHHRYHHPGGTMEFLVYEQPQP